MQRRLAAILAADVVGYSRLMGEDEAGTLDRLKAARAGAAAADRRAPWPRRQAHCAMGKARIVRREHAFAVKELELAIELNPSLAWAHYGLGACLVIEHLERAIRLSPRDQRMGSFMVRLAEAHLVQRDYRGTVEWARKALQQQGFQWSRYAALLAGLGFQGEQDEARRVLAECLALRPDFSVALVRDGHLYTDAAALDRYLEGLRLAGVAEGSPATEQHGP